MTGEGAYMVSDDGNYRLYISAGTLTVYYQNTTDVWSLYDGSNGSVYQMRFETGFIGKHILGYDRSNTSVYSGQQVTSEYIKLDNDGCLRWYYSDGTAVSSVCS